MTDDEIIDHIQNSLLNYDLRDIKLISQYDTTIASFILCSCFIEHICTFRYGKDVGKKEFFNFVAEYLPTTYDPLQLREDLRNKLVHNYSLGECYGLVKGHPHLHLLKYDTDRFYLNLENFISDLEQALNRYISELKSNKDNLRQLAVKAFTDINIIGLSTHNVASEGIKFV